MLKRQRPSEVGTYEVRPRRAPDRNVPVPMHSETVRRQTLRRRTQSASAPIAVTGGPS